MRAQLECVAEFDEVTTALRRSPLWPARRLENDAEYSWHLALMVLLVAEHSDAPIDVSRAVELSLVHHLVGLFAGHAALCGADGASSQRMRERAAAEQVFSLLPDDRQREMRDRWDEYDAMESAEARFVRETDPAGNLVELAALWEDLADIGSDDD